MSTKKRRFVVEYSLPYEHRVQVGIQAGSPEEAVATAERLFDAGDLWDDTESRPLLYDDYEEVDDGTALTFRVLAEVEGEWPEAASCMKELRRRNAAMAAARALVEAYRRGEESGGSVDWDDLDLAYEAALRAVGEQEAAMTDLRGKKEQ